MMPIHVISRLDAYREWIVISGFGGVISVVGARIKRRYLFDNWPEEFIIVPVDQRLKPISNRDDLVRALREHEQEIRRFGVRRVGLFGSFQRDTANRESDVDLLVEFEPGQATFDHFMGLSFYCDELLGRKVEIVTPGSLSPYIGPRIRQEVQYVLL